MRIDPVPTDSTLTLPPRDDDPPDFLDEIIAASEQDSPGFGAEVDKALARRRIACAPASR